MRSSTNVTAKFTGKLSRQTVLTVLLVLQIICIVGLVGYLSFKNGQKAVNDVATQLHDEIVRQIEEKLNTYTKAAHNINRLNAVAVARGDINIADVKGEHNWWQQVEILPTVTFIYCGDVQGNLLGAGKTGGRKLESWVSHSSTQTVPRRYYSVGAYYGD